MMRAWSRGVLLGYTLFMLAITLFILRGAHSVVNLVPLRSMIHDLRAGGQSFVVNFLGNFLAFLPFGTLLPLAWPRLLRLWQVTAIVGGFSLGIEVCQYLFAGRTADIDDVILNTLGGFVGCLFVRPFLKRNQRAADIHDSLNVA